MSETISWQATQRAYEMGCVFKVCQNAAAADLPDWSLLLQDAEQPLSPVLPLTDAAIAFGEAARPLLTQPDNPHSLAALWALLLGDALHGGIVLELLEPEIPDLPDLTRPLGPARRSAILRAANTLQAIRNRPTLALSKADLFSLPAEAVIQPLADLARTATEADIRAIATADQGAFDILHDKALRALLADPVCRMPETDRWEPAEGLALCSHLPDRPEGRVATALVIIDDIHHGCGFDYAEFRWFGNTPVYYGLPAPWRDPILRGFRHVMESLPMEFGSRQAPLTIAWSAPDDLQEAQIIPWYDDPA